MGLFGDTPPRLSERAIALRPSWGASLGARKGAGGASPGRGTARDCRSLPAVLDSIASTTLAPRK
jgi:hypothetical protein